MCYWVPRIDYTSLQRLSEEQREKRFNEKRNNEFDLQRQLIFLAGQCDDQIERLCEELQFELRKERQPGIVNMASRGQLTYSIGKFSLTAQRCNL